MLPQRLRLRKRAEFVAVLRRGRKVIRPTLVLYALSSEQARFGVVVGKRVGPAVTRNRVKRRLRHGASDLLVGSPALDVVVRALPAAGEPGAALLGDLRSAWQDAAGVVGS